VYIATALFIY